MADEQIPPSTEKKQTKAVPGKPVEGAELRKETVRINLPPKLGDASKTVPAPTVRLPRPEAGPDNPATVRMDAPTGKTAVLKVAPAGAEAPKKSDTAQVVPRTVAPQPTVPLEAPKPTVKLKKAEQGPMTTALPPTASMGHAPVSGAQRPTTSVPPEMLPPPPASTGLETALSAVATVLAIGVVAMLWFAMGK